jgi:hypothetical protein
VFGACLSPGSEGVDRSVASRLGGGCPGELRTGDATGPCPLAEPADPTAPAVDSQVPADASAVEAIKEVSLLFRQ